MKNLSPTVFRQRLIIEGKTKSIITDYQIKDYLKQLSDVLNMSLLIEPVTHRSEKFGWAGWAHWETSGVHFYAWEKPFPFFSSDIYTCRSFNVEDAVKFTRDFFKTTEIAYKSV